MTQPTSDEYAAQLAALYILAEQRLLAEATRILRTTVPTLEGRQVALVRLRRIVRALLAGLGGRTAHLISAMVRAALTEGRRDASALVRRSVVEATSGGGNGKTPPPTGTDVDFPDDPFDLSMPHGERAAQAIRDDLVSALDDVRFRLTRWPDDIYKAIAPQGAIYQVLENDVTPAHAQAMAWRVFSSQGVRGFTDKSGRKWSMSAYTEMAVRTAAARAYNASHLARMQALGIHYYSVPDTGHPCPLCFPWQHRVLTARPIENPAIPVDATIAEATAAGLFHPNCRHTLIPVFPGVTVLGTPEVWTPEMQDAYNLSQKQRRLELAIRKAKRRLEYAVDRKVRQEVLAEVRTAQRKLREFIAQSGYLRDTRREQLDLTDQYVKLPTPIR